MVAIGAGLAWLALTADGPLSDGREPAGPIRLAIPEQASGGSAATEAAQPELFEADVAAEWPPPQDSTTRSLQALRRSSAEFSVAESQPVRETVSQAPALSRPPEDANLAENLARVIEGADLPARETEDRKARGPVEEMRIALVAPDPDLMQRTSRGSLPTIGRDGRKPWQVYARPFDDEDERPRLAVVVSGLGLNSATTASAIRLPGAVTLSFTAYAPNLERQVAEARAAGHEVLLDLPMEPVSYPADDPGPHTLLTSLNPSDNISRLEWLLGRFTGYVGVINHMGSRFTVAPDSLRPILSALNERGLMFIDSRSSSHSVAVRLASQIELPRAINDRFVDHEATRAAIDQAFVEIERIARKQGVAVAVARPFPVTLERMAAWLPALEQRGISVAPITAVANRQADR